MIEFPDPKQAFHYEDGFLLTCGVTRIAKILCLYEAYKLASSVPGAIVECGVFKGASFCIFAMLRSLLENVWMRKLVAFDTFKKFAEATREEDDAIRSIIEAVAGLDCISVEQLQHALTLKGGGMAENIELIPGDMRQTLPEFAAKNPGIRIALLSIDVDFEESTRAVFDSLFPLVVPGGIVLFDDYGTFPGETKVVDEFLERTGYRLHHMGFTRHPCYIVKGERAL